MTTKIISTYTEFANEAAPTVVPRAANFAAQIALAQDVFTSLLLAQDPHYLYLIRRRHAHEYRQGRGSAQHGDSVLVLEC